MLEIIKTISFFILGQIFAWWWFSVIALPLFYALPKSIIWSSRGYLRYKSIFHILGMVLLWQFIFTVLGFILLFTSPSLFNYLLFGNWPFLAGQWFGVTVCILSFCKKEIRESAEEEFWEIMEKYKKNTKEKSTAIVKKTDLSIFSVKYLKSFFVLDQKKLRMQVDQYYTLGWRKSYRKISAVILLIPLPILFFFTKDLVILFVVSLIMASLSFFIYKGYRGASLVAIALITFDSFISFIQDDIRVQEISFVLLIWKLIIWVLYVSLLWKAFKVEQSRSKRNQR